jgi:hypothetical protein
MVNSDWRDTKRAGEADIVEATDKRVGKQRGKRAAYEKGE